MIKMIKFFSISAVVLFGMSCWGGQSTPMVYFGTSDSGYYNADTLKFVGSAANNWIAQPASPATTLQIDNGGVGWPVTGLPQGWQNGWYQCSGINFSGYCPYFSGATDFVGINYKVSEPNFYPVTHAVVNNSNQYIQVTTTTIVAGVLRQTPQIDQLGFLDLVNKPGITAALLNNTATNEQPIGVPPVASQCTYTLAPGYSAQDNPCYAGWLAGIMVGRNAAVVDFLPFTDEDSAYCLSNISATLMTPPPANQLVINNGWMHNPQFVGTYSSSTNTWEKLYANPAINTKSPYNVVDPYGGWLDINLQPEYVYVPGPNAGPLVPMTSGFANQYGIYDYFSKESVFSGGTAATPQIMTSGTSMIIQGSGTSGTMIVGQYPGWTTSGCSQQHYTQPASAIPVLGAIQPVLQSCATPGLYCNSGTWYFNSFITPAGGGGFASYVAFSPSL